MLHDLFRKLTYHASGDNGSVYNFGSTLNKKKMLLRSFKVQNTSTNMNTFFQALKCTFLSDVFVNDTTQKQEIM